MNDQCEAKMERKPTITEVAHKQLQEAVRVLSEIHGELDGLLGRVPETAENEAAQTDQSKLYQLQSSAFAVSRLANGALKRVREL